MFVRSSSVPEKRQKKRSARSVPPAETCQTRPDTSAQPIDRETAWPRLVGETSRTFCEPNGPGLGTLHAFDPYPAGLLGRVSLQCFAVFGRYTHTVPHGSTLPEVASDRAGLQNLLREARGADGCRKEFDTGEIGKIDSFLPCPFMASKTAADMGHQSFWHKNLHSLLFPSCAHRRQLSVVALASVAGSGTSFGQSSPSPFP